MTYCWILAAIIGGIAPWTVSAREAVEPDPPGRLSTLFPGRLEQGGIAFGQVEPHSQVVYQGRRVHVSPTGLVVFGIDASATSPLTLTITAAGQPARIILLNISPRSWPSQTISGLPAALAAPPAATAKRIARERQIVQDARQRDDERLDWFGPFLLPVNGPISGQFGARRRYNGVEGAPHSGVDIAAAAGTAVRAPASGIVTVAAANFYLSGGTIVLDHGYGISSNFLHLSRLFVRVGAVVKQGEVIGTVGATGRATGPHLHWGMTWFSTRIDPLAVIANPPCARLTQAGPEGHTATALPSSLLGCATPAAP